MGRSDEIRILGVGFMRLCFRVKDEIFIVVLKKEIGIGEETKIDSYLYVFLGLFWKVFVIFLKREKSYY